MMITTNKKYSADKPDNPNPVPHSRAVQKRWGPNPTHEQQILIFYLVYYTICILLMLYLGIIYGDALTEEPPMLEAVEEKSIDKPIEEAPKPAVNRTKFEPPCDNLINRIGLEPEPDIFNWQQNTPSTKPPVSIQIPPRFPITEAPGPYTPDGTYGAPLTPKPTPYTPGEGETYAGVLFEYPEVPTVVQNNEPEEILDVYTPACDPHRVVINEKPQKVGPIIQVYPNSEFQPAYYGGGTMHTFTTPDNMVHIKYIESPRTPTPESASSEANSPDWIYPEFPTYTRPKITNPGPIFTGPSGITIRELNYSPPRQPEIPPQNPNIMNVEERKEDDKPPSSVVDISTSTSVSSGNRHSPIQSNSDVLESLNTNVGESTMNAEESILGNFDPNPPVAARTPQSPSTSTENSTMNIEERKESSPISTDSSSGGVGHTALNNEMDGSMLSESSTTSQNPNIMNVEEHKEDTVNKQKVKHPKRTYTNMGSTMKMGSSRPFRINIPDDDLLPKSKETEDTNKKDDTNGRD